MTENEIANEVLANRLDADNKVFLKELYHGLNTMEPGGLFTEETLKAYEGLEAKEDWRQIITDIQVKLTLVNPKAAEQLTGLLNKLKRKKPTGAFDPDSFAEYYRNHDESAELPFLNIEWEQENGKRHPLTLSKGSFNVIGARPSNGKTTALISIAQEQLRERLRIDRQSGEEKPKVDGIVYISLEEIAREIYRKLLGSYICANLEADIDPLDEYTRADVFRFYKDRIPEGQTFRGNFDKAQREIYELTKAEKLTVFDDKKDINSIKEIVSYYSNHIILLDYLQIVKTGDKENAAYKEIKEVCSQIADAVKVTDSIVIAGAQLNREAAKTGEYTNPHNLTSAMFREGADIENFSYTAIVIDRLDREHLYWKVVKNRDGGGMNHFGGFKSRLDYHFLKADTNINEASIDGGMTKPTKKPKSQNTQGTGETFDFLDYIK